MFAPLPCPLAIPAINQLPVANSNLRPWAQTAGSIGEAHWGFLALWRTGFFAITGPIIDSDWKLLGRLTGVTGPHPVFRADR